jgi:tetratricopeptide (TPR) repeat protein
MNAMRKTSPMWPAMLVTAMVVLITAIVYGTGLRHQLIFDDIWIVRDKVALLQPINIHMGFRSLSYASFQWVHQVFGPDLLYQRLFNLVVHIVNTILLWWLTVRLLAVRLGEPSAGVEVSADTWLVRDEPSARLWLLGAAVAGLWALNPVAVYAVQYLTQRSTLLATMFFLLGAIALIQALRAKTLGARILLSGVLIACYGFALLSKEHAAPMAAALGVIYVYWQRPPARWVAAFGAVFAIAALVLGYWLIALKGWRIGIAAEDLVAPFLKQLDALQPGASDQVFLLSVVNQMALFFRYGAHWLIPWAGWLSIDIRPAFPLTWYAFPQLVGAVAFLVLVIASAWAMLRRTGVWATLGLIVLIPAVFYVTELAFVRLQEPFVLYRSYLWSVTIPALLLIILVAVFDDVRWPLLISGLLVLGWSMMAYDRVQSMRDDAAVWRDAIEKTDLEAAPNAFGRWRPYHNLAKWDLSAGRYAQAVHNAQVADRLGAPNGLAKQKIGAALVALRQPGPALQALNAAIADGYRGAEIWVSMGSALEQLSRFDEAEEAYNKALAGDLPDHYRVQALLAAGLMFNRLERFDKAQRYLEQAQQIQPDIPLVVTGLARAYVKQGRADQAMALLNQAVQRAPNAEFLHARGILYWQLGDRERAIGDLEQAVARDPANPRYKVILQDMRRAASTPAAR